MSIEGNKLKLQIQNLRAQIEEKQEEMEWAQAEVEQLSGERVTLREAVRHTQAEHESARLRHEENEDKVAALEWRVTTYRNELAALFFQLADIQRYKEGAVAFNA